MTAQLLYNNEDLEDVIHVLSFINSFTGALGITAVLDTALVERVVQSSKIDFPHNGGIEKASAFKQVANFVCYFVAERPILDPFPKAVIGEKLAKIDNHQNAMLAFAIAEAALNQSTIEKKDGTITVSNPIQYSQHSYIDIIDALSNITPGIHFGLVTVLFEQLVYKTNPTCQYQLV
jgi:hypothetical protein